MMFNTVTGFLALTVLSRHVPSAQRLLLTWSSAAEDDRVPLEAIDSLHSCSVSAH